MAAVNLQNKESLPNDDVLLPESKLAFSWSGSVSFGSSWSGLSSPFESEIGSTETESEEDEDEFMAELTRQMADYMLQEDDDESPVKECEPVKFRLPKEKNQSSAKNQLKKRNKEAASVAESTLRPVAKGTESTLRPVAKGAESTQQQERKKPHKGQNRAASILGSPPPVVWSPQEVNYGSGMRAVFLGGPDSKTRSSGTGVFLPGGASNPPEVRKKLGCSTVLIPNRVLNALQLHFENVNNRSHSNGPAGLRSYPPQHGINPAQEKRRSQAQSHFANKTNDIDLPQEWTY